jgi:C_GCAxxG_C_C family probable redox protein
MIQGEKIVRREKQMKAQCEKKNALYETASRNYRAGFNCSESVFRAFCEHYSVKIADETLKVASGFGGGIAYKEGPCGAATGAVMGLGLLAGRTDPTQDRKPIKDLTREFITRFNEKFGAISCGSLVTYEHGTPEQKENCHALTAEAAGLLMKFIEEKGLRSDT